MIVIDLGNKYSTISDSKNKITLPTTLMFDEDKVKIGCKQDEAKVIFDFVIDLGLKYHEATFNDGMKYYDFDFCKGSNDKIQVIIPSG